MSHTGMSFSCRQQFQLNTSTTSHLVGLVPRASSAGTSDLPLGRVQPVHQVRLSVGETDRLSLQTGDVLDQAGLSGDQLILDT